MQRRLLENRDQAADLRLQYRALLEAFSPGSPPTENANVFIDQISALNQEITELQATENELKANQLRESIAAKTAAASAPSVTVAQPSTREKPQREVRVAKPTSRGKEASVEPKASSAVPSEVKHSTPTSTPKVKKAKTLSGPPLGVNCRCSNRPQRLHQVCLQL